MLHALHSQMRLKPRMLPLYLGDLFELGYRGLGLNTVILHAFESNELERTLNG